MAAIRRGSLTDTGLDDFEAHNPATTWRAKLVQKIVQLTEDPDVYIADWLLRGAPMGITAAIPAGGWFPLVDDDRKQEVESLDAKPAKEESHQSVSELHGQDHPPAWT